MFALFAATYATVFAAEIVGDRLRYTTGVLSKAAMVSFGAILFSEWGDVGQVTTAALAARFGSPVVVWLGAVAAMITKGGLAASFGAGARRWIQTRVPPQAVRYGSVGLLLVLGILSTAEALLTR